MKTPKTDALRKELKDRYLFLDDSTPYIRMQKLARELERELTRAKTLAEENGKLAHKTACELAEARETIAQQHTIIEGMGTIQLDNAFLTAQRDRLAEAIKRHRAALEDDDHISEHDFRLWNVFVSVTATTQSHE